MISLNHRDARPIYEQIRDEFQRLIITGAIQTDEKLPSVRSLAGQLAINPNTIQRAYAELESGGYIYSVPGKGSFACPLASAGTARREELLDQFREITAELRYLGVTDAELVKLCKEEPK